MQKIVIISPQAKEDIDNILSYLAENWNQKVVDDFITKIEIFYYLVSINPRMFGYFNKKKNTQIFNHQTEQYFLSKQKK